MVINHTNHILIIRMGQPEIQDMCLSKLTLNTKTLLIVEQKKKKTCPKLATSKACTMRNLI